MSLVASRLQETSSTWVLKAKSSTFPACQHIFFGGCWFLMFQLHSLCKKFPFHLKHDMNAFSYPIVVPAPKICFSMQSSKQYLFIMFIRSFHNPPAQIPLGGVFFFLRHHFVSGKSRVLKHWWQAGADAREALDDCERRHESIIVLSLINTNQWKNPWFFEVYGCFQK